MLKKHILLFTVLLTYLGCFATHNRAGEITYRHVDGFTYEITITTCTKSSVEADREWIYINFGDSPSCTYNDSIQRNDIENVFGFDAQINTYIGLHTYAGIGSFTISVLDPNRNSNVLNIPASVDQEFYIESELIISPLTGHNNSVILLNDAKEECCVDKLYLHNPGAYDPDGDFLQYSLVPCKGALCEDIEGYSFPENVSTAADSFTIDPNTGTVVWDVPQITGEYNFAILIEEFREVNGQLIKVGSVIRDMQINVQLCDNNPPVIEPLIDTCILINNPLVLELDASDPDGDQVNISATGGPLTEVQNQATFNDVTEVFIWIPDCPEVRNAPYQVTFIAEDVNPQPNLADVATVNIRVIAPAVQNTNAEAIEGVINLTWDPHSCTDDFSDSEQEDFFYKIYRRNDLYGFDPDYCETGVPAYTGYELIATLEGLDNSTYLDDEVFYGGTYCYMVVTCWPDGAESLASEEFCAEIRKEVPVITHVSVMNTDLSSGVDSVGWSPPTQLDTNEYQGPYQYKLYWSPGSSNPSTLIYQSSISPNLLFEDTVFIHSGINTFDTPNVYNVEFFSDGDLVAPSSNATSVFIEIIPDDNQLTIDINYTVPWQNTLFEIFRFDGVDWVSIGTTTENSYVDEGLNNNEDYCYYVKATGTYNAEFVKDPLINFSQEACGFPVDLTPPCPPELSIEPDCDLEFNDITWTNPFAICGADDVMLYNLYYAEFEGEDFELYQTFVNNGDNNFVFNQDGSLNNIAGCFYITAEDSIQPGLDGQLTNNESEPSNIVCIDNCPQYSLPNIFTPNGDELNNIFTPFDPVQYIDSVDFQIFNRWGGLVFKTADPLIGWDGTSQETGEICSDGTYYYVATVYTRRLTGIVPEEYSGYIQLLDGKNHQKVD